MIDCLGAGLEQLHTEVFRCEALEAVVQRAEQVFSLMPPVDFSRPCRLLRSSASRPATAAARAKIGSSGQVNSFDYVMIPDD